MKKYLALVAGGICLLESQGAWAQGSQPLSQEVEDEVVSDSLSQQPVCSQPMYPDGERVSHNPDRDDVSITFAKGTKLKDNHTAMGKRPARRAPRPEIAAAREKHGVFHKPSQPQVSGDKENKAQGVKRSAEIPQDELRGAAGAGISNTSRSRLKRTTSVRFGLGYQQWGNENSSEDHIAHSTDEE